MKYSNRCIDWGDGSLLSNHHQVQSEHHFCIFSKLAYKLFFWTILWLGCFEVVPATSHDKSNDCYMHIHCLPALNQIKLGFWPHFVHPSWVFLPRNFLELEAGHFLSLLPLMLQNFYCFFPWKSATNDNDDFFLLLKMLAGPTHKKMEFYNGHNNDITIKKTIVFIFNRKTFVFLGGRELFLQQLPEAKKK